jgi:RNA polymerase sigma factor for flagellar operon FliA
MQAHATYQSIADDRGELEARDALILGELPQVYFIAARIHERLPASVQMEDLVSAGVIGLIEACKNFDAARNAQFTTFARFRIRGAILDSLRLLDWGSRAMRRKAREITESTARLETRLGRSPQNEEIAQEMKISLDQMETTMAQIDSLQIVGQQGLLSHDSGEAQDFIESAAGNEPDPFELFVKGEQKQQLTEAIASLNEREQLVLSLYYKEELTMKEVAQVMGIALSRVSQIHTAALGKLRTALATKESRPTGPVLRTGMLPRGLNLAASAEAARVGQQWRPQAR